MDKWQRRCEDDPDRDVGRAAGAPPATMQDLEERIPMAELDIITVGRSGVDLYPLEIDKGLEDISSFGKFLGGSPTNVAVAAARYGHRSAVVTGVGNDPFGRFVRTEMRRLGVDDRHVVTKAAYNTPVTFCEIFPPDNFPLYFYREPSAPDLELTWEDLPLEAIRDASIFWISPTRCQGSTTTPLPMIDGLP